MEKSVSSLVVLLALVTALSAAQEKPVRQCGVERWPVKIWADKDAKKVRPEPIDTTISELRSFPIHEVPYPNDARLAPEELRVYRVRARLLRVKREQDSDLHLLLADATDPEARMIAEIPAPECAEGSRHEGLFRAAREAVLAMNLPADVEITGVGFFDFLHGQRGAAPNGLELHPVLVVRAIPASASKAKVFHRHIYPCACDDFKIVEYFGSAMLARPR